ncbi:MAG: hypothetical protein LH603_12095 [Pseudonocardia sp.]|nr:hypothetical protein [Pseudonocardia sp.]
MSPRTGSTGAGAAFNKLTHAMGLRLLPPRPPPPACSPVPPRRLPALATGIWRNWALDVTGERSLVAYDH